MTLEMIASTMGGETGEMIFVEHPHWCVANSEAKKKFYSLIASTRATLDLVADREKAIFGHVDSQGIKHEGLLDALASASSGDQKPFAEELRSIAEELDELSNDLGWDAQRMDLLFPKGKVVRTQPGEKNQLLSYEQNAEIEHNRIEALIFKFTLTMIEIAPRKCLCEVECDADVIHDEILAQPYVLFEQQPVFKREEVES